MKKNPEHRDGEIPPGGSVARGNPAGCRTARGRLPWLLLVGIPFLGGCGEEGVETASLYRAPAVPNQVDGVIWEAGNWEPHLPAGEAGVSWGNHRAVVEVDPDLLAEDGADAVRVIIPWRRHDPEPSSKAIIVVDAASGEPVENALAVRVENASGEVVFQPNPGSSTYHVYYMPWQSTGGYYPTITYPTPEELRDPARVAAQDRASVSRADRTGAAALSWAGKISANDPAWEAGVRAADILSLPEARTTRIQSVNAFHSFFPMEVIATREETAAFMEAAPEGWRMVPEHRDYPVAMRHFIPWHWVAGTSRMLTPPGVSAETSEAGDVPGAETFRSRVLRDEAFTFQLALVAGAAPLDDVRVSFGGFPRSWISGATCFNCRGIDEKGQAFTKTVRVPAGTVQPLWLGIRIPAEAASGPVEGTVTVSTSNRGIRTVPVTLEVSQARAENHGFDVPELQSRLFWLNSTLGTDPDFIIEPFQPVGVEDPAAADRHSLTVLGRRIDLGPTGLPEQIHSYFTPELTHLAETPEPILARPVELRVRVDEGESRPGGGAGFEAGTQEAGNPSPDDPLAFQSAPYPITREARGQATWTAESETEAFAMTIHGRLEYDGMLDYRITLVAREEVSVADIALPVSYRADAAEYMLGLGRKGGERPPRVDWKWAVENHQEGVWLGAVHKGLQYVLRDENYVRPLNTNFYRNQPLNLPPSWFNGGRGGIRIVEEEGGVGAQEAQGDMAGPGEGGEIGSGGEPRLEKTITAVTAHNYSGPRTLAAGDTLHFNVRFLITPFKPMDTVTHFNTRFVHQYVPVDSVVAWGGTVVNIHHANEINPYINYPFFNLDLQSAYIDEAHEKGVKVKLYNTIRELSYRAHELFALRSLGDEILNDGEGGGHSWMQEHLEDHYHSAWHAWRVDDAAMLNKGTSRWTNYYVEGLNWLAEHQDMDGLYLDDIAFSRETVKRMVTVLHTHRPDPVIDLHSANQFNVRDGFINSAFLYMEHFPFINRLWFGEYFEYDLDPDYWMTEVSGLPFGLMGEMLQDGGHPYRGLLYGMTSRKYGDTDPRPVWAMMNDFGMAESRMLGYWLPDAPVRTDHPEILATTYVRDDAVLLALASWSHDDEVVELGVDWEKLGLAVGAAPGRDAVGPDGQPGLLPGLRAYTPAVAGLQEFAEVDLSALRIPAGMGLWVVVERER